MSITIKPLNTAQIEKIMEEIAPREANNLARATNHGVAGAVRNEVKSKAPVGAPNAFRAKKRGVKKGYGPLKKSIKAKRERARFGEPYSTVRISAFYWRFVENGTARMAAQPFVDPTVEAMRPRLPQIWREQFGKKLEASLRRKAKRK